MIATLRTVAAALLVAVLLAPTVRADVLSVDISERSPIEAGKGFGDAGPYEEIVGRITFGIDPTDSKNQVILNLDRAPRNAQGLVYT